MTPPTEKKIGDISVSVAEHGYPHWTRINHGYGHQILLGEEEARDLLYAMQRIVAFLDAKEAEK